MNVLCIVPHNIIHETEVFLRLQQQGVNMRVVTGKIVEPDYGRLQAAGIPVYAINLKRKFDRKAIQQIRQIIIEQKIAIVHAFNNRTVTNGLRACKGLPVKFIAYRGIVGNVSFFSPYSWLTYLNPRVDRIICVANAIRDYLLNLRGFGLRIPPEKVVTIYKGHDPAWYQLPAKPLTEFAIPTDAVTVGCIANFRPRKGIPVLLEAMRYLAAESRLHLLLIGDMSNSKLQHIIQQHPLRDRIHVTGYRSDAIQLIASCDMAVLPSIKREGLPKAVIEAMIQGVPVIVTNSGGSPELIEAGISGLLVPPNDAPALAAAMQQLYQQPEQRQKMGQAARERILTQFTVDNTVAKTYELYQTLLKP